MIPARIIASFAAFALLSACGLKGPLYLPKEPAEPAPAPAAKPAPQKPADPQTAPANAK
jgi:predicted small lipoprotein YifL